MKKLLLALLLFPLLAQAASWVSVGSGSGSQAYIDKSSIIRSTAGYKVWSLVSFAKEQTTQEGTTYQSVKALHIYSCGARSATLLSQVYYGEAMGKGPVAQNIKYEKFSPQDIVPDSPPEWALQAICKRGGKK
ncbi:MAG: surface-adhesin E family protein [Pseudomonadota bacterium]